jgi:hypothetical protein
MMPNTLDQADCCRIYKNAISCVESSFNLNGQILFSFLQCQASMTGELTIMGVNIITIQTFLHQSRGIKAEIIRVQTLLAQNKLQ